MGLRGLPLPAETTNNVMLWAGMDWLMLPPATATSASRWIEFADPSCHTCAEEGLKLARLPHWATRCWIYDAWKLESTGTLASSGSLPTISTPFAAMPLPASGNHCQSFRVCAP